MIQKRQFVRISRIHSSRILKFRIRWFDDATLIGGFLMFSMAVVRVHRFVVLATERASERHELKEKVTETGKKSIRKEQGRKRGASCSCLGITLLPHCVSVCLPVPSRRIRGWANMGEACCGRQSGSFVDCPPDGGAAREVRLERCRPERHLLSRVDITGHCTVLGPDPALRQRYAGI